MRMSLNCVFYKTSGKNSERIVYLSFSASFYNSFICPIIKTKISYKFWTIFLDLWSWNLIKKVKKESVFTCSIFSNLSCLIMFVVLIASQSCPQGITAAFSMQKQEVFCKKAAFKNFEIFTEAPVLESFFNKVAGLQAGNFIKKRLQYW